MSEIDFIPRPDQFVWTFGGAPPVATVQPGDVLRLWTEDAFGGVLQRTDQRPSELLDTRYLNPQTGPFLVAGAEPGDTLAIHLVAVEPARDWAASTTVPFFGGLTATDRTAMLHPALPERTWIYQLDRARRTVLFESTYPTAGGDPLRLELPIDPMLGTVGVAPPLREVRSSLVPDTFGGNMDTPEMRAGVTCYLPVNVEGALFSIGDGHYRQGEGESCGTAVEGAMDVTLIVDLVKGGPDRPAPSWPRIESDDHLVVVGSARPLEDAWRASQVGMIGWLGELYGLDPLDGYQLLTQISLAPLANVVDVNYSALTKLRKDLLPPARAYDGLHADLRARAAALR
ncbi:acetamidase/formamidase family protein [Pseudonocardia sp. WMMC193]|uniref:acetamidase/formamidase family protein n=1 Tax=Pseudonocardia sp. WMMC193 TaxID=2911965 RepID=UPI001F002FFC|nr:acetamidase/formamidase family protein [Pseudonocardia sp. WMMC193]MCF7553414.1 acetamidase/formamidase family protein [Pseudonocardia sp. WMMC193]